jgi:hypothetical protein
MKHLLTVLCLLLAAAVIDVNSSQALPPVHGVFSPSGPRKKPRCPTSIRQAARMGHADAKTFRKKYPSRLWPDFLIKTSSISRDCPGYVRKAYVDSARKGFEPVTPSRFFRP